MSWKLLIEFHFTSRLQPTCAPLSAMRQARCESWRVRQLKLLETLSTHKQFYSPVGKLHVIVGFNYFAILQPLHSRLWLTNNLAGKLQLVFLRCLQVVWRDNELRWQLHVERRCRVERIDRIACTTLIVARVAILHWRNLQWACANQTESRVQIAVESGDEEERIRLKVEKTRSRLSERFNEEFSCHFPFNELENELVGAKFS